MRRAPLGLAIVGLGVVVLAAAAGVSVWLLTRSDDKPTQYLSPEAAVVATCHADPGDPPTMLGDALYPSAFIEEQGLDFVWHEPGDTDPRHAKIAVVGVGVGNPGPDVYAVITCRATIATLFKPEKPVL